VVFYEKRSGAAPCQAQLAPASSQTARPLAKAEPGGAAGTSLIIYLRKGKNRLQQL